MSDAGLKVLLIDDSDIQLHFVSETLRRAGFEVRGVTTIPEFDAVLFDWSPDIVVTDLHMPDVSGAELCRMLKSRLKTNRIPVVLFSSLPDEQLAPLAKCCGADAYLSKYNGLNGLADKLQALCESIIW